MHFALNIVTETHGKAGAVLIRAVQPLEGKEVMRQNRTLPGKKSPQDQNLTNGPGKLCQAFGITRQQNGLDLTTSEVLYLEDRGVKVPEYQTTPRIGISQNKEKLWRFLAKSSKF
jgi:DNA-3-methyladenine glycosylase